jgi:hypothetical protein
VWCCPFAFLECILIWIRFQLEEPLGLVSFSQDLVFSAEISVSSSPDLKLFLVLLGSFTASDLAACFSFYCSRRQIPFFFLILFGVLLLADQILSCSN